MDYIPGQRVKIAKDTIGHGLPIESEVTFMNHIEDDGTGNEFYIIETLPPNVKVRMVNVDDITTFRDFYEGKWMCHQDCRFIYGTISFTKGKLYKESGEPVFENGIELINNQGNEHIITGKWLNRFTKL